MSPDVFADLEMLSDEEFLDYYGALLQFDDGYSDLSMQSVMLDEVRPLCKIVVASRLQFAARLRKSYIKAGIPLFRPVSCRVGGGRRQWVFPPVVERRSDCLYLCDGMHRLFEARQSGLTSVNVLVIGDAALPLPGKPVEWDEVVAVARRVSLEERFASFRPEGLTGYSRIANSDAKFR